MRGSLSRRRRQTNSDQMDTTADWTHSRRGPGPEATGGDRCSDSQWFRYCPNQLGFHCGSPRLSRICTVTPPLLLMVALTLVSVGCVRNTGLTAVVTLRTVEACTDP